MNTTNASVVVSENELQHSDYLSSSSENFFTELLSDFSEPTSPYGLNRLDNGSRRSEAVVKPLTSDISSRILKLAEDEGINSEIIFHLAWTLVVSRVSSTEDVVVGVVVDSPKNYHGKTHAVIPLRIAIDGRGVKDALRESANIFGKASSYSSTNHSAIQECSGVNSEVSLYSTCLQFTDQSSGAIVSEPVSELIHCPLALTVYFTGEKFSISTAAAKSIDPDRINSYVCQALEIITSISEPKQRNFSALGDIDVVPDVEKQELIDIGTATSNTKNDHTLAHEAFIIQAARTPNALAVAFNNESITYKEVDDLSNNLAQYLRNTGVKADTHVGICVVRSIDMVVGILAILKAGGAYIPFDSDFPEERLLELCNDCKPLIVLTHSLIPESAQTALVKSHRTIISLDEDNAKWDHLSPEPVFWKTGIDNLAYCIYTSGTSGRSKAAAVTHAGISNLLDWYIDDIGIGPNDKILLATSHCFDLSQKNILGPLAVGAELHLAETPFNPRRILSQVSRYSITFMNMAPSAFHALIDFDAKGDLSKLRRVMLGGESIQPGKLEEVKTPRPLFINSYGPTECSDVVAYYPLDDKQGYEGVVPLGKPIRNTRLYVLDKDLRICPFGVEGELCIAGTGVSRGYLYRDELTAERFLPDAFVESIGRDANRMYRTGDLVKYRPDGLLEFIGRNDFQVKLHGFRIELGDIETRLIAHENIIEAAVLVVGEEQDPKRIVAFYVATNETVDEECLQAHLVSYLPGYMVPASYIKIDKLPLTSNGKLDRRALERLE